jgi:hypothetical protein
MQNRHVARQPLIVVGPGWQSVLDVLGAQLVVDADDLAMITAVADVESAVAALP